MLAITGGAGFIGSVLAAALNSRGHRDLLIVDQQAQGSPKWKNVEKRAFAEYLESDRFLSQLEAGAYKGKLTAVFHLGACSSTTEMDTAYLRENNSGYSERVAKACLRDGIYLQYASSAATYGDGELGFSDEDALTPNLKPLNPYGQSKLDFDIWVLRNGYEKHFVGFRYFNVYGPNEYHKGSMRSLAEKGYEQVAATGKLKLFKSYRPDYPDGGQKRDFVYVKDCVEAMLWFFEHREKAGIYNLGTGRAQSWNELARAIFKAAGRPESIEYIEMPDSIKGQYQYFTEADLSKLRRAGCPVRFRSVEEGVADYAALHLSRPDRYL